MAMSTRTASRKTNPNAKFEAVSPFIIKELRRPFRNAVMNVFYAVCQIVLSSFYLYIPCRYLFSASLRNVSFDPNLLPFDRCITS